MSKTILITGATDGIGLLTAKKLANTGQKILLHGRSNGKLDKAATAVGGRTEGYKADLSDMQATSEMADAILENHSRLDVLINNAGVLKTPNTKTADGYDIRFVVNTFAPYVLAKKLLPIIPKDGRIINLSSAAQAPVEVDAMTKFRGQADMDAYAQSKLAITIWSQEMAKALPSGPVVVAVNPGSLLASKMVKEGFGIAGNDLDIGADIICKAAFDNAFADASGKYFDNDTGAFGNPHPAAMDTNHVQSVMDAIEGITLPQLNKSR